MGALPSDKAGVGSAVNDTTRELGGTFGVAIVGSVFASVFGSRLASALGEAGVPGNLVAQAQESMAAALTLAQQLPGELGGTVADAAQSAFTEGLQLGSLVAAGVVAVGAVLALLFLPSVHTEPPHETEDPNETAGQVEAALVTTT